MGEVCTFPGRHKKAVLLPFLSVLFRVEHQWQRDATSSILAKSDLSKAF